MTGFHYQAAQGARGGYYERRVNGQPHIDEGTGKAMQATNVVIVYGKFWPVPKDSEGRLDADLTGTGKATVLRQGVVYDLTWRKLTRSSPLVLVDAEGQPARLDPGQTWILVVPDSGATVRQLAPQG
jgi:hypothetical protein